METQTYPSYEPDQILLLPPSMRDWLPRGHLPNFILDVVASLDLGGILNSLEDRRVERLWRTVKYENVFLNDYEGGPNPRAGLGDYFGFDNNERRHQSLGNRAPIEVYNQRLRRAA